MFNRSKAIRAKRLLQKKEKEREEKVYLHMLDQIGDMEKLNFFAIKNTISAPLAATMIALLTI